MHSKNISVPRTENEKQLLCFLCASNEDASQRRELATRMSQYAWRSNDHQILFEAIGELLHTAPQEILHHLPAALTRLGFPDISCGALAQPPCVNSAAAFALAEELLRASQ